VEIREAKDTDFDAVFRLKVMLKESERSFTQGPAIEGAVKDNFEKWLKDDFVAKDTVVLVAVEEKTPVGMVVAKVYSALPTHNYEKRGYLSNLFVEEKFRRKGIARELMNSALDWLKKRGARSARAEVHLKNASSLNLCHSLGFADYSVKIFKDL